MDQVYDAGLPAVGATKVKLKPTPVPSRTSLDPDLFVDRSRLPE